MLAAAEDAAPYQTGARPRPANWSVIGARENNLKNISVTIPHRQLSVVTGVSGSGKSTLAFDIVFAEGQRRFMESMSPYARQFVEQLPRPDVDRLTGIPPTVAIEQRVTRGSRKSTVATPLVVAPPPATWPSSRSDQPPVLRRLTDPVPPPARRAGAPCCWADCAYLASPGVPRRKRNTAALVSRTVRSSNASRAGRDPRALGPLGQRRSSRCTAGANQRERDPVRAMGHRAGDDTALLAPGT